MKIKYLQIITLVAAVPFSGFAFAYNTDIAGATRVFSFDSSAFFAGADDDADALVAYGDGNISGNAKNGNIPAGWSVIVDGSSAGYATDIFQVSGMGVASGGFSILDGSVWNTYSRIAIGLKVGNAQKSPDWAIFELEQFASAGTWATNTPQGLSHYMVYAISGVGNPSQVPVPGAFWLLGSALAGMLVMGRAKRAA
ncbi:hypothetical protein NP590_13625 [Methylomonas sp. SURF-2]|uniref:Uncharacterized protein n=1 Tax=Methylomonas subterranea TaxID=2952225 RepID=A0ABT1TI80_9GAMM|nr:hypothetical protein [Methylomonas sp. SURF-2]MCQ8105150.1 hypothetical protein [Methylomonas sp. SURF-2]